MPRRRSRTSYRYGRAVYEFSVSCGNNKTFRTVQYTLLYSYLPLPVEEHAPSDLRSLCALGLLLLFLGLPLPRRPLVLLSLLCFLCSLGFLLDFSVDSPYALVKLLIVDLAGVVEVELVKDDVNLLLWHSLEAEEADGLAKFLLGELSGVVAVGGTEEVERLDLAALKLPLR